MCHYCYQWMLKNIIDNVWGDVKQHYIVVEDHSQSGDTDKLLLIILLPELATRLLPLPCYGWQPVNDRPFMQGRDAMLINDKCAPTIGESFSLPHTRTTMIIITIRIRALDEYYIDNDIS